MLEEVDEIQNNVRMEADDVMNAWNEEIRRIDKKVYQKAEESNMLKNPRFYDDCPNCSDGKMCEMHQL